MRLHRTSTIDLSHTKCLLHIPGLKTGGKRIPTHAVEKMVRGWVGFEFWSKLFSSDMLFCVCIPNLPPLLKIMLPTEETAIQNKKPRAPAVCAACCSSARIPSAGKGASPSVRLLPPTSNRHHDAHRRVNLQPIAQSSHPSPPHHHLLVIWQEDEDLHTSTAEHPTGKGPLQFPSVGIRVQALLNTQIVCLLWGKCIIWFRSSMQLFYKRLPRGLALCTSFLWYHRQQHSNLTVELTKAGAFRQGKTSSGWEDEMGD